MTRKLTNDQILEVISSYTDGESGVSLGKRFGVSRPAIYSLLRTRDIPRRTVEDRLLPVNQGSFDELTEDSLYWAGFIAADGSIIQPKRSSARVLKISLAEKDRDHLVKFRQFLGSDHKITDYTNKSPFGDSRISSFSITSDYICTRLSALGVKSSVLSQDLTDSRHFWRGVMDGDGSLGKRPERTYISLYGQMYTMNYYQEFLKKHLNIEANIHSHGSIYKIVLSSGVAGNVMDYLYRDANVYLDRKQLIADRTLEYFDNRRK